MDVDDQLSKKIDIYKDLAKENPNVDVAMLMVNALTNQKQNVVSTKAKRWAYLISIGVPPFGIIFAVKYFFGDQDDARQVAWTCVILTIISLIVIYFIGKLLFNSAGITPSQIEQIKPSDIQQIYQ